MNGENLKIVVLLTLFLAPSLVSANDFIKGLGVLTDSFDSHIILPSKSSDANSLTNSDIIAGLKDTLRVGSENVVRQLSKTNGFNTDPTIHIPLPAKLQKVKSTLSAIGQGNLMDNLELKLNRAAEAATPKAKKIFVKAIQGMNFTDAKQILRGRDDAATEYFKGKMSKPLSNEMYPIIIEALSQAGAVQAYESVMGKYQSLPFVPNVKADLTKHVLDLTLHGVFYYMAKEEAAIRKDPVKRTSEILKKVFGR